MALCLNKTVEAQLRSLAGNNVCSDCNEKQPQWASVSFGIFMCLECSGRHRALGVHISFVRSVTMDSWNDKQIKMMTAGGNDKCNNFLKGYNVQKILAISQKYNTPAAALYRDRILAEIEGRPLPTELKAPSSSIAQGSDPLPGEDEADYVARQRKLQEEARERMRQKFGKSSGLSSSSGAGMTGIGSDSSYRPGQQQSSIDLSQVSQTAFSFISTSAKAIGDKVSTLKEDEAGWGAWGANIWSKTTEATTDLLTSVTTKEESDLFNLRSSGISSSGKMEGVSSSGGGLGAAPLSTQRSYPSNTSLSNSSTGTGSGSGSYSGSGSGSSRRSNENSWDDLGSGGGSNASLPSLNKLSMQDPEETEGGGGGGGNSPLLDGSSSVSSSKYGGDSSGGNASATNAKKKAAKLQVNKDEDNWDDW